MSDKNEDKREALLQAMRDLASKMYIQFAACGYYEGQFEGEIQKLADILLKEAEADEG
jgi:hypothetical protein